MTEEKRNELEFKDLYKQKMDFLQKAIDDTQNIIRFTDTKAAAVIAFWGIISTILIRTTNYWLPWFNEFDITPLNLITVFILILMFSYLVKSVALAYLVIVPKMNPNEHIIDGEKLSNEFYFISALNKNIKGKYLYRISKEIKLISSPEDYKSKISEMNHEGLLNELIMELHKVSFIRTIKVIRANGAMTSVIKFLILVLILIIFKLGSLFSIETNFNTSNMNFHTELFIILVVGHIVINYLFQTGKRVLNKRNEWISLLMQSLVSTIVMSILVFFMVGIYDWVLVSILFISHVFIDKGDIAIWWSKRILHKENLNFLKDDNGDVYRIEQVFHLTVIFILSFIY